MGSGYMVSGLIGSGFMSSEFMVCPGRFGESGWHGRFGDLREFPG